MEVSESVSAKNHVMSVTYKIVGIAKLLLDKHSRGGAKSVKMISLEEELKGNAYPGRGIVIGKSQDGRKAVTAYFIWDAA